MAELEYQYGGETISYSRARGGFVWQGSSHAFETPEKAEASIDRANGEAKDGAPKFEKRKAIFWSNYGSNHYSVTVTSQDGPYFWITNSNKRRSKEHSDLLYAATDDNLAKCAKYDEMQSQIDQLREQQKAIKEGVQSFADWLRSQK